MALVTLRILDGPDRGQEFFQIATPVTIGREEGNLIRLNDHRVSRNHMKIHESGSVVLMTDLQSTNGTKVNGESVRVWHLQPGDLITIGRSMLLFGSVADIAERLTALKDTDLSAAVPMGMDGDESDFLNRTVDNKSAGWTRSSQLLAREIFRDLDPSELLSLQQLLPPVLPKDLSPQQAAQMEALLQYLHLRLRYLVSTVRTATSVSPNEIHTNTRITLSAAQWQNIIDLHARITAYMSGPTQESDA